MCTHVLNATNVSHPRVACISIRIFMQVNTSAQNVADVVTLLSTLIDTDEVIQGRNRLNVLFVANDLQHHVTLLYTVVFTVERNRTNATCVRKHLVWLQLCTDTWESTREINLMIVLTVGSCLRQTLIWSFMFVFTLAQSRTHVDTVHSILHGLRNSRDICWSHTMKVLGWHVTFVRRNSTTVVTLSGIYFDMKVWSLMHVVSVLSVSVQCTNWNLISWYTQTTKSFAVVCVVKTLNTNVMLFNTLRNVLLSWDKAMFNQRVDMYLLLSHSDILQVKNTRASVATCSCDDHFRWCPQRKLLLLERKLLLIKLVTINLHVDLYLLLSTHSSVYDHKEFVLHALSY